MPSKTLKQHKFMEAVAHNPAFAKKVGIPRSVGEDFSKADKGKSFKKGGEMIKSKMVKPSSMSKDVEKGSDKHGKFGESKVQKKGHTKGKNLGDTGPKEGIESEKNMKSFMKKYAKGGTIIGEKMAAVKTNTKAKFGDGIAERGKTRGRNV